MEEDHEFKIKKMKEEFGFELKLNQRKI